MDLDSYVGHRYKLDHSCSINYNEYLLAMGVGDIQRHLANTLKPYYMLTKNGDEYTLSAKSACPHINVTFKLGEEVEFLTPHGKRVKSIFTVDGTKLIEKQKGEKNTTLVRDFSETEMRVTLMVDDIVATRVYKAV